MIWTVLLLKSNYRMENINHMEIMKNERDNSSIITLYWTYIEI